MNITKILDTNAQLFKYNFQEPPQWWMQLDVEDMINLVHDRLPKSFDVNQSNSLFNLSSNKTRNSFDSIQLPESRKRMHKSQSVTAPNSMILHEAYRYQCGV